MACCRGCLDACCTVRGQARKKGARGIETDALDTGKVCLDIHPGSEATPFPVSSLLLVLQLSPRARASYRERHFTLSCTLPFDPRVPSAAPRGRSLPSLRRPLKRLAGQTRPFSIAPSILQALDLSTFQSTGAAPGSPLSSGRLRPSHTGRRVSRVQPIVFSTTRVARLA